MGAVTSEFTCPRCAHSAMQRLELPDQDRRIMVINPVSLVLELGLGMRIAKLGLLCLNCDLPRIERVYVPCPTCSTVHDSRLWSGRFAFGNWRSLVCPTCLAFIPCLWSYASLIVLTLTAPIWWPPYHFYFRHRSRRPHVRQAEDFPTSRRVSALWMGFRYGLFMWLCFAAIVFFLNGRRVPWEKLAEMGVVCALGGLIFGTILKAVLSERPGNDCGSS